MTSPIARIILRYAAGLLVMKGLLSTDLGKTLAGDVDLLSVLELVIGFCAATAAEWWYAAARKFGWSK